MNRLSVITAVCVAISTQLVKRSPLEIRTSALFQIKGTQSITEVEMKAGDPTYELGKTYEVSFLPAAEQPQTESAPSTETPDAPVSEGQTDGEAVANSNEQPNVSAAA